MKIFLVISFVILMSCQTQKSSDESIYYINNQKDFNKYSGTVFPEGSKVLFAEGKEFTGEFILHGSGSGDRLNLVTSYNPESKEIYTETIENKAKINGKGMVEAPIRLYNGQYWEIKNIEVTNTNGTKEDQGLLKGIYIVAEDVGEINNININNCYVHDVNGDVGGKWHGGIHIHVIGDSIKTKFNNLKIENNRIEYVGGVGIGNQSTWRDIDTEKYYPWTNFVVRGNFINHTGRNSIILRNATKPLIEYNVAAASSRFDTGHSIVNFNTIDCVVQFNEAYGNTGPDGQNERGGFDADYKSTGTIIQYNYSHDNDWFCGIMRRGKNSDITIRYNISQNELMGCYLYGFPTEFGLKDVKVYNNTHYFGKGKGHVIFVSGGKVRHPIETVFKNNIFYFEDKAQWGFEPEESCFFSNNLFYNVPPIGENAVVEKPIFLNIGSGGTNINMRDPNVLAGYQLAKDSPGVNAGTIVENNGGRDFAGNNIYNENPDIGAFEYPD